MVVEAGHGAVCEGSIAVKARAEEEWAGVEVEPQEPLLGPPRQADITSGSGQKESEERCELQREGGNTVIM